VRRSGAGERLRQQSQLPRRAESFEAMLGLSASAVAARRRYFDAIRALHRRLEAADPLRQCVAACSRAYVYAVGSAGPVYRRRHSLGDDGGQLITKRRW
jgi:hypothetical protein